jgi:hypothetical protein
MQCVLPTFESNYGDKSLVAHTKIDCYMIFDIKMVLTRKALLVWGCHQTDPPKDMVYSSMAAWDSVWLGFLIAALNDLDILAVDMQGTYLNSPTTEQVYTIAETKFGSNAGRSAKVIKALYGLQSSGAQWQDHMAATLRIWVSELPS